MEIAYISIIFMSSGIYSFCHQHANNTSCTWKMNYDSANNCCLISNWQPSDNNNTSQYKLEFKNYISKSTKSKQSKDLSFNFIVSNIDSVKSFDSNYFEGPDAPAEKQKLLCVKVNFKNGKNELFFISTSGSFTSRDGEHALAFQFEASYSDKDNNSPIEKLLKSIEKSAESFSVSIYLPGDKKQGPIISAIFKADAIRPYIKPFLDGNPILPIR